MFSDNISEFYNNNYSFDAYEYQNAVEPGRSQINENYGCETKRQCEWGTNAPQHRPLQDITSQINGGENHQYMYQQNNFHFYKSSSESSESEHFQRQLSVNNQLPVGNQQCSPVTEEPCGTTSTYQHHRLRTNRRKRERNMSINHAFDLLRERIPNLPEDTKVSKIRILQLACDYIRHLDNTIKEDDDVSITNISLILLSKRGQWFLYDIRHL